VAAHVFVLSLHLVSIVLNAVLVDLEEWQLRGFQNLID
jgi:hypothetical protein